MTDGHVSQHEYENILNKTVKDKLKTGCTNLL